MLSSPAIAGSFVLFPQLFLRGRGEKSTEQTTKAEAGGLQSAAAVCWPVRRATTGYLGPILPLGRAGDQELVETRWLHLKWVRLFTKVWKRLENKNSVKKGIKLPESKNGGIIDGKILGL